MRSLTARILLGFIALTVTFGIYTATMVLNLREVEDQASLILRGYFPLALSSADLVGNQEDLTAYLEQGLLEAVRPAQVTSAIGRLRKKRDDAFGVVLKTLGSLNGLVDSDGQAAEDVSRRMPKSEESVNVLKQQIADVAPLYPVVLAAPPLRMLARTDPAFPAAYAALDPVRRQAFDTLQDLVAAEKRISSHVNNIHADWKRHSTTSKDWLAENERTILLRAVYLGVAAVVLGFLITAWVAVMLRPLRRLREGARRIAAGDYGMRIPEAGPMEISDLAREFNSMGRAVQDREEEKLRAARLAMVGKMAAQIAHEVRNPLSSIGLNTELLEDELGANATEARELCRAIHTEVNRLTEVTETYLGLRGGKPRLARESINTIIGDLVGFVRNDLATRQVTLETDLDAADPTALIDANQIRQCLINLVRNAADAVAAQGGGRVVLRTRSAAGQVEVAVEDNGVGIERDLLPRLFDPFFSTKEGGSGLGLALTQQIVRDHGGDIRVASRVGRGTTFTLAVPTG